MHFKNRRQFFKFTSLLSGGLFLSQIPFLQKAFADAKIPLLKINDPTAKAVGYIEDHKKSPKAKDNKCTSCTFYKKGDTRNGKEVGTCLIFPGKYVYGDGYCNSWAKKA